MWRLTAKWLTFLKPQFEMHIIGRHLLYNVTEFCSWRLNRFNNNTWTLRNKLEIQIPIKDMPFERMHVKMSIILSRPEECWHIKGLTKWMPFWNAFLERRFFKKFCTKLIEVCSLTHWGRDKMDAISQTTFSSAFSSMKMFEFWLKFHWSLFVGVQLTIFQHWFR